MVLVVGGWGMTHNGLTSARQHWISLLIKHLPLKLTDVFVVALDMRIT